MKKRRRSNFSALREQLRREDAAAMAKLTPAERLRIGLELSEFGLKLYAAGQKARVAGNPSKNRRNA
jgi:hypothetical protein